MEPVTSPPPPLPQRLLVPIDARNESRWPIRHALGRVSAGRAIEVFLVYILPPTGQGDLLRFPAEQQEAVQLLERADLFLEAAAGDLLAAGIPCHRFIREADPVQGIRDFAEEWACSEVLVPDVYRLDVFKASQRHRLEQLGQTMRITWVGEGGSSSGT